MLVRMWRKSISFALLVGMQTGAASWKTIWRFLKKLKIELPYHPVMELLDIYPPKYNKINSDRYINPYIYYSIMYDIIINTVLITN